MAKVITVRIHNGSSHEIDLVKHFTWCGHVVEAPPQKILAGDVGSCVIKRPLTADAVGGAVVYRITDIDRDFMLAFENPLDSELKNLTLMKIGSKNQFSDSQSIEKDLFDANTDLSEDSDGGVIAFAKITACVHATCTAVLSDDEEYSHGKSISVRIYNGSSQGIEFVDKFAWDGSEFSEPPPAKISPGQTGVCIIQSPSNIGNDSVGGAVVYGIRAPIGGIDRKLLVAFENPFHGTKNLNITLVGSIDEFTDEKCIRDALVIANTGHYVYSDPPVIAIATITGGPKATCVEEYIVRKD